MFNFSKTASVASRVATVVNAHVEQRGDAWILGLGYQECNDYAALVVATVSAASQFEHIRFETVARYIRTTKNRIRAKRDAALKPL